jgi:tetratricopeptide (TPR) repeat protein
MQKQYKIIMKLFKLKKIHDRSYTLYNIGLIYGNTGKYTQALEFYHQALSLNPNLPQALNNIAVFITSTCTKS